jgi:hypothetical protein
MVGPIRVYFANLVQFHDGSGRVHRGHPEVFVSLSLSPWRHELQVIQRMRRLSAWRLEVGVGQEAVILACLWFMGGFVSCSSS